MDFYFDIAFQPGSNGQTVIVSGNKIARSTNGGDIGSFTILPNTSTLNINPYGDKDDEISIRFSESNPSVFYGAFGGQPHGIGNPNSKAYLFKYDLSTNTLHTPILVSGKYSRHQAFAVNPFDEDEIIIGDVNPLNKSTDGGQSWVSLYGSGNSSLVHDDLHWVAYHNSSNEIWVTNDGGIDRSIDGGLTWESLTNNIGCAVYFNIGTSERLPDQIIGGGWDTGSNFHDPETNTFKTFDNIGDAFESVIDDSNPLSPIYFVSTSNDFLVRHQNSLTSGVNVISGSSGNSQIKPRYWNNSFVKYPRDQKILFYAGDKSIGRTINSGNTWESISPVLPAGSAHPNDPNSAATTIINLGVWVAPNNSNYVYCYTTNPAYVDDPISNKLFWTSNAMASASQVIWVDITPNINSQEVRGITNLAVDENNPDNIWVTRQGFDPSQPKVLFYNGSAWSDITGTGLENLSVKAIAHQHGTNGLVYVGTNNGVFYKTNSQSNWTKLDGLPHVKVSELEISHCAGLIRACTFGRGIWEASLVQDYNATEITGNTIWNQAQINNGPVIIKAGAVLTVNETISFGAQSSILIEKGGKLIIDGGHLTNDCQKYWGGISIEGTPGQIQNNTNSGFLEIKNGGKISYAKTAITNGIWNEDGVVLSSIGGMIHANGAVFENNNRDVELMKFHYYVNSNYEKDYYAKFINCDFTCNDEYRLESKYHHITMWDVEGVQISGCRFMNSNTGKFKNQTSAIFTQGATYKVTKFNDVPSEFIGYDKAIYSENTIRVDKQIKILDTEFSNNRYGIYLKSTANAKLIGNEIVVDPVSVSLDSPHQYGLYLDHSYCYVFHNNDFSSNASTSATHDAIGVVFRNNGDYANLVYRNNFDGFDIAAEALGYNKNANNTKGLNFRCNRFGDNTSNGIDIYVREDPRKTYPANQVGVAEWQGSVINNASEKKNLANNLFSLGNASGFNNTQYPVFYFTGNDANQGRLNPVNGGGVSITNYSFANFNFSEDCSDPESTTGGWEDQSSSSLGLEIDESDLFLSGKWALLNQLIDEGDSPELQAQILASLQPDYQNLYLDLMDMSPYVSEENLINVILISDFPELALRNILIANPHASRSPEIMDYVENKVPALSAQTISDIMAGEATITTKDVIEGQISNATVKLHNSIRKLINYYVGDSLEDSDLDSLNILLKDRKEVYYRYSLIDNNLALSNISEANSNLSLIPTECDLNDFESDEYIHMTALYNILISNAQNNNGQNQLGASDIAILQNIESTGLGLAQSRAQDLLSLNGVSTSYIEPTLLPSSGSNKLNEIIRPKRAKSSFSIFPNPAQDHIILSWNWFEAGLQSPILIEIVDISGKIIEEFVINDFQKNVHLYNVGEIPKGSYIFNFVVDRRVIQTEKVQIFR